MGADEGSDAGQAAYMYYCAYVAWLFTAWRTHVAHDKDCCNGFDSNCDEDDIV